MLEVVKDASELDQAERWWIAFGWACGWPLTNLTAGGGPSKEAIAERNRRNAENALAATLRNRIVFTPEEIAERQRIRRGIPRDPAEARAEVREKCFRLFEKHFGSNAAIVEAVVGASVTFDTATRLYEE